MESHAAVDGQIQRAWVGATQQQAHLDTDELGDGADGVQLRPCGLEQHDQGVDGCGLDPAVDEDAVGVALCRVEQLPFPVYPLRLRDDGDEGGAGADDDVVEHTSLAVAQELGAHLPGPGKQVHRERMGHLLLLRQQCFNAPILLQEDDEEHIKVVDDERLVALTKRVKHDAGLLEPQGQPGVQAVDTGHPQDADDVLLEPGVHVRLHVRLHAIDRHRHRAQHKQASHKPHCGRRATERVSV